MQIELKRIQTEVGLTFIHVTHDQEEAMTMADTVAVMNAGVIEQMGAPGRALREPAHHVRGQLPRPVQPDRGHDHGPRRRPRHRRHARHRRLDHRRPGARRRRRGLGRHPAGEGADRRRGRGARRPGQHHPRRRGQRRQLRRRQHAVPRPDAVGPGAPGLRAEHRPPPAVPHRRAGRAVLATGVRLPPRPQPGRLRRRPARGRATDRERRSMRRRGPDRLPAAAPRRRSGWRCSSSSRSTRWSRPASTTRAGRYFAATR